VSSTGDNAADIKKLIDHVFPTLRADHPDCRVYLPELVFSHGQFYVTLSRATAKSNIKIVAIKDNGKDKNSKKRKKQSP
jgi:hypothetical protein